MYTYKEYLLTYAAGIILDQLTPPPAKIFFQIWILCKNLLTENSELELQGLCLKIYFHFLKCCLYHLLYIV